ncbi:MAG TPA: vWA domain-containing protein [Phycisphaerae bacterium]|nr:vWA domain-containing protein [Phycisphaerae bacterium]
MRERTWKWRAAVAVLAAASALAWGPLALGAASRKATAAKSNGDPAAGLKDPRRVIEQRFEGLTHQYVNHLNSPDWITRSVAVISLSRMPVEKATEAIVQRLQDEKKPVGQLVAWQTMLGRAPLLTEKQHRIWQTVTEKMIGKKLFHGDLRIGLLEMLSASPATRDGRAYFTNLFRTTSSLDSSDIPTLIAMGHALRAWGDKELVEQLLRTLGDPSTAVRAELILQAAGADVPWNRTPAAAKAYAEWWRESRDAFTSAGPDAEGWKRLKPQFIAAPVDIDSVDLTDRKWRDELELGRLELRQYDFAIAIDCSRSMRPEIERLKRDMRIMFLAFSQVALEPRVGLTLFAPGVIVKHYPLTGDLNRLMGYVSAADIMGPAGEEEWAGALKQTMAGSQWAPPGRYSRRAIALVSDEPITKPQADLAVPLAQLGAKAGFRIYGVMIRSGGKGKNNPLAVPLDRTASAADTTLPASKQAGGAGKNRAGQGREGQGKGGWGVYDTIAAATGAKAIDVRVPQGIFGLGLPPQADAASLGRDPRNQSKKGKAAQGDGKTLSPVAYAPVYAGGGPTNRVLIMVLVDAINPQYADRVEPFVKILVAYCQQAANSIPEKRTWGPPDEMEPNRK